MSSMLRVIPVRVAVIDDDPGVCRKLGNWLREAGCDAVTFTRPEEGLAHIVAAPCQVALVDLRLSGTSGPEVIAALRRDCPTLRIVALSAFPEVEQVAAAMRAGANDLLEKPIQPEALRETLNRQLAQSGIPARSEEDFNRRLGARLRAVRTQRERTLAEVAERCGLTVAQLSQIELGKTATTTWSLARICAALETPLEQLFRGI